MKKIKFYSIAILFFLSAFKQKEATQNINFPPNEIGFATSDQGDFPYLSAPDGYEYRYEKKKSFEEKYFFLNNGSITKKEGRYFFSVIWKSRNNKGEYEKTFVLKSYQDALKGLGASQIFSGTLPANARSQINKEKPAYFEDLSNNLAGTYKQYLLKTPNGNVWFELFVVDNEQEIRLSVIQEEGFKQTIKPLNAIEIKKQLDQSGKAILYINFDTDKSSLKRDGITEVEEIVKVLNNDKSLRISIEGHTDNVGNANHNKILSSDRANTVLKKLMDLKIESKRLKAIGYGADKPLASNDTELNRAKNRRVELVKL